MTEDILELRRLDRRDTDMHFEVGASLIALSLTSLTHGVWFYLRAK